ncbi:shikimate dehydrogenase [Microbacterium proteolyticum]|uniref:shikimate dehydrogenase family protein n=1 Tax=Microbacterium proteolyticum TaxID=1572644 RepID=UPI0024170A23|nr:shikimate dehydrogenase [Microbacterium proteolyticum]
MPTVYTPDTLEPAAEPTFCFVGVTTGASSIMTVYPAWAEHLGISPRIVGVDVPLDASPEQYRAVVEFIAADPQWLGGLVTTHKLNLFRATRDLFSEVGESAGLLDEISSISKRADGLHGHAMDDVTSGLAFEDAVGPSFSGDVVLLGAGGASLALTLYLHRRERAGALVPERLIVTNRRVGRLDEMRALHRRLGLRIPVEYRTAATPEANDAAVATARPGALIVNATGLGKDRPGSPLTDAVVFPERSVAWDFNYRGDLVFLDQARAAADRGVRPVDGWFYFLHGWTRVIAQVFDIDIPTSGPRFDELSRIARSV